MNKNRRKFIKIFRFSVYHTNYIGYRVPCFIMWIWWLIFRKSPYLRGFQGVLGWKKQVLSLIFSLAGSFFPKNQKFWKCPVYGKFRAFWGRKFFPWNPLMMCSILAFGDKFLCKLTKREKVQNTLLILQKYIILCRIGCCKIRRNGAVLSKIYGELWKGNSKKELLKRPPRDEMILIGTAALLYPMY